MAKDSKIQWTDHTFNPWWGCEKVSPGCTNCYAEALDKRTGGKHWGTGAERRRTSPKNWLEPLKWNREARAAGVRKRVFCASVADWLDDAVPAEWLADLLELIDSTPHLDWLLLTKRPHNWRSRMERVASMSSNGLLSANVIARAWLQGMKPANVWIGTTVEDQRRADERIPLLLAIPACIRFLSCEPLIEAVQLHSIAKRDAAGNVTGKFWDLTYACGPGLFDARDGNRRVNEDRIDWVIVGGESGPIQKVRPFDLDWAREIIGACLQAGVPVFMKQLGHLAEQKFTGWVPPQPVYGIHHLEDGPVIKWRTDGHGGDWFEWPEELRVREFPEVR